MTSPEQTDANCGNAPLGTAANADLGRSVANLGRFGQTRRSEGEENPDGIGFVS